jgi:hypothetical protein
MGEGTAVRTRVVNFLTMDNINDDADDNNMMKIWKSNANNLPKLYGHDITVEDKSLVDSMM